MKILQTIFMCLLLVGIHAKIVPDRGYYVNIDHTITDLNETYVVDSSNGTVNITFTKADTNRRVKAAQMTFIEDLADPFSLPNVQLVNQIFSEEDWNTIFMLNANYTYDQFLRSVAQFPAFCGEFQTVEGSPNTNTQERACKRELATLFAHIVFESGDPNVPWISGLKNFQEAGCFENIYSVDCMYNDDTTDIGLEFPAQTQIGAYYYGRGPLHLRWNGNYGRFSRAYFESEFKGESVLLNNPFQADPQMWMTSALWVYMTPRYPKPSAHDVMTGFYEPNGTDLINSAGNNFGTTIDIMTQDSAGLDTKECNVYSEDWDAVYREDLFRHYTDFFGLDAEPETGCKDIFIGPGGTGDVPSFFDYAGPMLVDRCELTTKETEYSVYNAEDYARCICYHWAIGADLDVVCPQAEPTSPTCTWTEKEPTILDLKLEVANGSEEFEIDLITALSALTFPDCGRAGSIIPPDFLVLELVEDNMGRRETEAAFRAQFQNTADELLFNHAPTSMYVATTLGQRSLIYNVEPVNVIYNTYDAAEHDGTWRFRVRACINDESMNIDCDPGTNFVSLEIFEGAAPETVEVETETEEPEIDPDQDGESIPDPAVENTLPFFTVFDPQQVYEVARGAELVVQLSAVADADLGDQVVVTARLPDRATTWMSFDAELRQFRLEPSDSTSLGLAQVLVLLDDSKGQSRYYFSFWVTERIEEELDPVVEDPEDPDDLDGGDDQEEPVEDPVDLDDGEEAPSDPSDPGVDPTDPALEPEPQPTDPKPKADESKPAGQPTETGQPAKFDVEQRRQGLAAARDSMFPGITDLTPAQLEQVPEPQGVIAFINEIGRVKLTFSHDMLLRELLEGFEFGTAVRYEDDEFGRRSLVTGTFAGAGADLSSLLRVEVARGDDDTSARPSELGFDVKIEDYDERSVELKFEFENPLSVSIGDEPDTLVIEFVENELFTSRETGKSLAPHSIVAQIIPKQFLSETAYAIAVAAGSTVQAAANTAFLSQFGFTICLAVSLKSMWNLMHVMQVMAYLRLVGDWPANANMMLLSMHNAITLENLVNDLYDSWIGDFDEEFADDEESLQLEEAGVAYDNIYLSLGIFGICLGALVGALVLYLAIRLISMRVNCCHRLTRLLQQKLFFSVWIRYMIESNLFTTHNCIFFLYISGAFGGPNESFSTAIRIFLLTVIVIWPFFMTGFLHCRRQELDTRGFQQKFISMYSGIKTEKFSALIYTSVFCVRRLLLVITLILLQDHNFWLICAYNALQTFHFWYIAAVMPHAESIHNRLEIFNELAVISMQYLMIFFVSSRTVEPLAQWQAGKGVMVVVGLVFLVNIAVLIYLTISRVMLWTRARRARKEAKKALELRRAVKLATNKVGHIPIGKDELNDAKSASEVESDLSLLSPAVEAAVLGRLMRQGRLSIRNAGQGEILVEDFSVDSFQSSIVRPKTELLRDEDMLPMSMAKIPVSYKSSLLIHDDNGQIDTKRSIGRQSTEALEVTPRVPERLALTANRKHKSNLISHFTEMEIEPYMQQDPDDLDGPQGKPLYRDDRRMALMSPSTDYDFPPTKKERYYNRPDGAAAECEPQIDFEQVELQQLGKLEEFGVEIPPPPMSMLKKDDSRRSNITVRPWASPSAPASATPKKHRPWQVAEVAPITGSQMFKTTTDQMISADESVYSGRSKPLRQAGSFVPYTGPGRRISGQSSSPDGPASAYKGPTVVSYANWAGGQRPPLPKRGLISQSSRSASRFDASSAGEEDKPVATLSPFNGKQVTTPPLKLNEEIKTTRRLLEYATSAPAKGQIRRVMTEREGLTGYLNPGNLVVTNRRTEHATDRHLLGSDNLDGAAVNFNQNGYVQGCDTPFVLRSMEHSVLNDSQVYNNPSNIPLRLHSSIREEGEDVADDQAQGRPAEDSERGGEIIQIQASPQFDIDCSPPTLMPYNDMGN